ncbi:MAG: ABC transporter permease [Anaerolineales bacterium]
MFKRKPIDTPRAEGEDLQFEVASQWQLTWWKFRKHKLAMFSAVIVILLYLTAIFGEFIAPYGGITTNSKFVHAPPQTLHLFSEDGLGLHVYGYTMERDPRTLERIWTVDPATRIPISLFVRGEPYKMWGLVPGDLHLIGPKNQGDPFFLFGTDRIGRDVFSRIVHSARISLTVGLVGIALTFLLGIFIGGISGLVGGRLDDAIQRVIEILISIPTLPFWLALASMVPITWSSLQTYFMISIILTLLSWMGLARVVRSKFLALRNEDFVLAAKLDGCSNWRLITSHMLPSFMSHIIASVTLSIPGMIIGETALSFLGLGLRPPIVSWGVMLQDAQRISAIANYPWLLTPAAAIFITVLSMNFLGDGLRDAADPYQS